MRFVDWLQQAEKLLTDSGIGTARLDALVLAEDVIGIDRAMLIAEPDTEITPAQNKKLKNLLKRRSTHEPLAYIRGKNEFYGREFLITPDVLEPRPESETMIDELKKLPNLGAQPIIGDIGTGSGALGITAKLELPEAQVELIDIDAKALQIAKMNVDKFTLPVKVIKSNLLAQTTQKYDVLLCNLPYVPDDFKINTAASHEPRLAIFGGPDGLDLYRQLLDQIKIGSNRPLYLLFEALPLQHSNLETLAQSVGYTATKKNDFILVLKRTQK